MIDPTLIKELLDYDPLTGAMTWRLRKPRHFRDGLHTAEHQCKVFNSAFAGREAFNVGTDGYKKGRLLGRPAKAHRVAFAHYYGRWPLEVDHINRDRSDNRISNLREVTHQQNSQNRGVQSNNKTGIPGVSWSGSKMRWIAYIKVGGKQRHIGTFSTMELAAKARKQAERLANG